MNQDATSTIQLECTVAINPIDEDNVLAAAIDYRTGQRIGYYVSFDGGRTIATEGLFPLIPGATTAGDPTLAFDGKGVAYLIQLQWAAGVTPAVLFRSTDGGRSWSNGATVAVPSRFPDKPWLTIDQRTSGPFAGSLYLTYQEVFAPLSIRITRSRDRGRSWSRPVQVTDSPLAKLAVPAVGPNGEVYVAWLSDWKSTVADIMCRASIDGAMSFQSERSVARIQAMTNGSISPPLRAWSTPSIAVDRSASRYRGRVYVAWPSFASGSVEIFVSHSSDTGATWSPPVRANTSTLGDQFLPWITCDENGVVYLSFYDRRDDPTNRKYHLYVAASYDGGATFTDQRVSEQQSDYSRIRWVGEYQGIAAQAGRAFPAWVDFRNGDPDIYTARIQTDLIASKPEVRASSGGRLDFEVRAGPLHAGRLFALVTGASGHSPGLPLSCGVRANVNFDPMTDLSIQLANQPPFMNTVGTLDASGSPTARPSVMVPGGVLTALIGRQLTFAYVVFGTPCGIAYGSQPVDVAIVR